MLNVVTQREKSLRLWCVHQVGSVKLPDGRKMTARIVWPCTRPVEAPTTYCKISGWSWNGPACQYGDKPFKHVELYGEIYTNQYKISKEIAPLQGVRSPSVGRLIVCGQESWGGRRYEHLCVFLPESGEFSTPYFSYKFTPPEWREDVTHKDGGYWTCQCYQWDRYRSEWVDKGTRIATHSDLPYLYESGDRELLLPWQHRLSEGIYDMFLDCLDYYGNETTPHWGDLCQEAVQGTRAVNLNTLMYCKELLEIGDMLKSTISSLKNWKSSILKESANLYLSYHYGYRLSAKDTADLYKAAKHEFTAVKRSIAAIRARQSWEYDYPPGYTLNGCTCERTRCVKVWYKQLDAAVGSLLNGLFRWDVFPELGNVYDMIPYSFVVDWFLPFGDVLDKIDNHTYAATLNVLATVRSDSYTIRDLPLDSPLLLGVIRGCTAYSGITLKLYHRWLEKELTYPPLELKLQAGPKNWLPAGALILQRTK